MERYEVLVHVSWGVHSGRLDDLFMATNFPGLSGGVSVEQCAPQALCQFPELTTSERCTWSGAVLELEVLMCFIEAFLNFTVALWPSSRG